MPENTEFIEKLVYKFNNGTISTEELEVLRDWYNSHDDENVVIPTVDDESASQVRGRMLAGLLSKVKVNNRSSRLYPAIKWIATAAAAVMVVAGIWMMQNHKASLQKTAATKTSIEPGGNKATLTLADGREIVLSTSQDGIVSGNEIRYANGTPIDNITSDEEGTNQTLSLHTPRGGTYRITLPDGTQVWLNAESTLKYPMQFAANERIVELEGEAYFHVKPASGSNGGKLPFKVLSDGQQIEVLGTQFNMTAYGDQKAIKTTLVEGSVEVSAPDVKSGLRYRLKANEQAVTYGGKTSVKQVDASHFTAWREGKFSFDGKSFEETMSEIGRWYDLKVVYENGVPQEELAGDAFRNQNISLVLRLMDVAQIDYKLDVARRVLTIKGKK